jgi:hypothetical protein
MILRQRAATYPKTGMGSTVMPLIVAEARLFSPT